MPVDYTQYPTDWPEIRARILRRDGHRCKFCGLRNGLIGYRDEQGQFQWIGYA